MFTALVESSWGVYINATPYTGRPIPKSCLTWVKPIGKDKWQECGVIIWDNETERMEVLSAAHVLKLLEYLWATDTWKAAGILIVWEPIHFPFLDDKKSPNKQVGKGEEQIETQEAPSTLEGTIEEGFWLKDVAAEKFFDLLQTNEALLHQMAEADEKRRTEFRNRLYRLLIQGFRSVEGTQIDLSVRPFVWVQDKITLTWTCDRPPRRGTVQLSKDNFFWRGCIEQPDRFKHWSPSFLKLEPALAWVELKLAEVEQEVIPKQEKNWPKINKAELVAKKRIELAPYWIEAAALEPERITYRVIIELDYSPYKFKTMEMSFGKQYLYDKKCAYPGQLARELQLDPNQVEIEQLFGPHEGWYRIVSRVTYYQADLAAAQAQQLWDKSLIVRQYRAKQVIRAQYGFKEVETGFCTMLGGCENPDQPYSRPLSREKYMVSQALRETLAYALDIEGMRSLLGLSPGTLSDESLLAMLHRIRARSTHIPLEAQLESERRLRTHKAKG